MSKQPHIFCPGCEKNKPPVCFDRNNHLCRICSKMKKPEEFFTDPKPSTLIEEAKAKIEEEWREEKCEMCRGKGKVQVIGAGGQIKEGDCDYCGGGGTIRYPVEPVGYTACPACSGQGCDRCMPHIHLPE